MQLLQIKLLVNILKNLEVKNKVCLKCSAQLSKFEIEQGEFGSPSGCFANVRVNFVLYLGN